MNFDWKHRFPKPKPRTEDDFPCNWEAPPAREFAPMWCGRRARYFYLDVEGKLCARCYEHRHVDDARMISEDEFLVQILMDL